MLAPLAWREKERWRGRGGGGTVVGGRWRLIEIKEIDRDKGRQR